MRQQMSARSRASDSFSVGRSGQLGNPWPRPAPPVSPRPFGHGLPNHPGLPLPSMATATTRPTSTLAAASMPRRAAAYHYPPHDGRPLRVGLAPPAAPATRRHWLRHAAGAACQGTRPVPRSQPKAALTRPTRRPAPQPARQKRLRRSGNLNAPPPHPHCLQRR